MKALFTSVPVQPAIQIVKQRLQQDTTLPQRTSMSICQITSLLEFCLTQTYFLFQGKYYQQTQGATMGSPISPLMANIFMEEFEVKALQSLPNPPSLWLRFVDDTFVINKAEHSQGPTPTHKQPGPTHTVHSGAHTTWITTLPGHSCHNPTTQPPQCIGNQHTQTNTFTGTATTTSLPNKVYATP